MAKKAKKVAKKAAKKTSKLAGAKSDPVTEPVSMEAGLVEDSGAEKEEAPVSTTAVERMAARRREIERRLPRGLSRTLRRRRAEQILAEGK